MTTTLDDLRTLNPLQLDALREVANIGAGHAATALSQMTGGTIMISVPTIHVTRLEDVPNQLATRTRPIPLLAAGHACVDVYQGTVAALVPFFVSERAYTFAAAAGLVGVGRQQRVLRLRAAHADDAGAGAALGAAGRRVGAGVVAGRAARGEHEGARQDRGGNARHALGLQCSS